MTENDVQIFWRYSLLLLLTWPLHLIRVPKIFWCRDKHLGIGDRRPERNHIKSAVMSDGSILLRVHNLTCLMAKNKIFCFPPISLKTTPPTPPYSCQRTYLFGACSATHRKWRPWRCAAAQRWGHWVRGESVRLSHWGKDGPSCGGCGPRGRTSPGVHCSLESSNNEVRLGVIKVGGKKSKSPFVK